MYDWKRQMQIRLSNFAAYSSYWKQQTGMCECPRFSLWGHVIQETNVMHSLSDKDVFCTVYEYGN